MAPKKAAAPATIDDLVVTRAEAYAAAEAQLQAAADGFEQARQDYAAAQQVAASKMEEAGTALAIARVERDRMYREADAAFDEGTRAIAAAAAGDQA